MTLHSAPILRFQPAAGGRAARGSATGARLLPFAARRNRGAAEKIAGVLRRVLGVDEIPPGADFFALGGRSLQATSVIVGIERELGVRLSLRSFFRAPTVEGLAAAVEASAASASASPPAPAAAR